jgi:hypothetical protein
MCPPDQTNEKPDDDAAAADGDETAQEQNHVVVPLTDDELRAGGMKRTVAYIRTERSKEALRKEKHRNKQKIDGKRQINLNVPDDDRSRATMRGAAIAIEDEVAHRAFELLLADEELRPLIVGVAVQSELREIVDLIQQRPATAHSLNAARLAITDPAIAGLIDRATADPSRAGGHGDGCRQPGIRILWSQRCDAAQLLRPPGSAPALDSQRPSHC